MEETDKTVKLLCGWGPLLVLCAILIRAELGTLEGVASDE